jgi:hypothetical protein
MYLADYDDHYMMSNTGGATIPGWGYGPPDSVPGQQMAPYVKNTQIHVDPMDPWQSEDQRVKDHLQYMGNPAVPTAEQRMYALMVRSNIGYNYAFFSPWRYIPTPRYVGSVSLSASEVNAPAATIQFGSAIWDRASSGSPIGGGNWVIETPCWLDSAGVFLRPMKQYATGTGDGTLWSYPNGWDQTGTSWLVYGGLWPFYNQTSLSNIAPGLKDGHVIMGFADTHVKSMPIKAVTAGCSAYGTGQFKGKVTNPDIYLWDLD